MLVWLYVHMTIWSVAILAQAVVIPASVQIEWAHLPHSATGLCSARLYLGIVPFGLRPQNSWSLIAFWCLAVLLPTGTGVFADWRANFNSVLEGGLSDGFWLGRCRMIGLCCRRMVWCFPCRVYAWLLTQTNFSSAPASWIHSRCLQSKIQIDARSMIISSHDYMIIRSYDHMTRKIIWPYDRMIVWSYEPYDHATIWSYDRMTIWPVWSYDHMIVWSYDHMTRMIICPYDHMIVWS